MLGSRDPDFKDSEAEARWVAESLLGTYRMRKDAGYYLHAEMTEITRPLVLSLLLALKK